jgi:hypothetical protein
MGWLALVFAVAGVAAVLLPAPGMFVGAALAISAIGLGRVGFARSGDAGPRRLAGAGAVVVGSIALLLAVLRYALTLAAIERIERMLG